MAKMKIYEIAKSLNIKSGELVKALNENGFEVKSHNSNIEDDAIGFILKHFTPKKDAVQATAEVKEEPKKEEKPVEEKAPVVKEEPKKEEPKKEEPKKEEQKKEVKAEVKEEKKEEKTPVKQETKTENNYHPFLRHISYLYQYLSPSDIPALAQLPATDNQML